MSKRKVNFMLSVWALLLGGIIYLLFRKTTIVAGLLASLRIVQELQVLCSPYRFKFLQYYFVDFLWGFSLCSGLVAIHSPKRSGILLCAVAAFGYGCTWEILQYFGVVTGTGDWWDIVMYFLASALSVIINYKERIV